MLNRRQENEDGFTSRLIIRLDYYVKQGVCTSSKVEITGNVTELGRLSIKTLSELPPRIGSKEFPHIQLERYTRSTDIGNTATSDESSDF